MHYFRVVLQNGSLNFTRCEIIWLCKHFFYFSEMHRVFISLKKKACKWITSIGWTGHLRGVQGLDTLRWFTIWGKQIGSDNTGWSMLPISPTGNVSGRLGNYFCKPFFKFWVSLTPLSPFSWRTENWELREWRFFLWLWNFLCNFYFLYQRKKQLTDWTIWLIVWPNSAGKCEHILYTFQLKIMFAIKLPFYPLIWSSKCKWLY